MVIIENVSVTGLANRLAGRYAAEGEKITEIIVTHFASNRGSVDVTSSVGAFRASRLSTGYRVVKL